MIEGKLLAIVNWCVASVLLWFSKAAWSGLDFGSRIFFGTISSIWISIQIFAWVEKRIEKYKLRKHEKHTLDNHPKA